MADIINKIREWVLYKQDSLMDEDGYFEYPEDRGAYNVLSEFDDYINSLTQEPVSKPIDFEKELYKDFGQIKDFTLGIAIAKRFYDMGRKHNEPVSEQNLSNVERIGKDWKEGPVSNNYSALLPCIYNRTLEERVKYCKYCSAACEGRVKEPVNEELEQAAVEAFKEIVDDGRNSFLEIFKAGAKWQKEQFEKNRLKHCNSITNEQAELEQGFIDQHLDKHQRMPTFLDAIEYGMRLKEKQIMENATEATVAVDAGGYPYIPQLELYDYDKDIPLAKEGDKYKVVLIKED